MGDNVLLVDDLWKRYGKVEALKGLSFGVPRGAFFGLLGRNGSGKTTTLDIVTGLLARDRGHVQVLGEQLGAELSPEAKARLGYVAGHLQLYDWMTCDEHVRLMAQFYETWDDARERQLLEMFRIPLDQRVGTLSQGQNVQLQLLMALAHRPELLIIDEPGNLDAVVRQRLMETMIEAIAEEETTVIMASHIISELDGVCDHLCIIEHGVAWTAGPVEQLLDSVRRLHFRGVKRDASDPIRAYRCLRVDRRDGELRLVLPEYTPERAQRLSDALQADDFDTERLGLQEVFVALTGDEP